LPERGNDDVRRILRGMWDNLGRVVAEYPHLKDFATENSRIEVVGTEHIHALRDDGKAGIFVSAHYGNWELNAAVAKWNGIDLVQVYRAANNPLVDPLITRARSHVAGRHIPTGAEGARQIIAAIRTGEHLGLLVDQKMNDGIPVPFFGRDAMTAPAAAELALRYGLPIVPARVERLSGAHFRVTVYPPLDLTSTDNKTQDALHVMTAINSIFEDWIRERPDHWFWLHRRWPD
jgi:KDO2-lipid IV(A) lauroyltransferase